MAEVRLPIDAPILLQSCLKKDGIYLSFITTTRHHKCFAAVKITDDDDVVMIDVPSVSSTSTRTFLATMTPFFALAKISSIALHDKLLWLQADTLMYAVEASGALLVLKDYEEQPTTTKRKQEVTETPRRSQRRRRE